MAYGDEREAVATLAGVLVDLVQIADHELALLGAVRIGADDADQEHGSIVPQAADSA